MTRKKAMIDCKIASGSTGLVNYMIWILLTVNLVKVCQCRLCDQTAIMFISPALNHHWVLFFKLYHDLFIILGFIFEIYKISRLLFLLVSFNISTTCQACWNSSFRSLILLQLFKLHVLVNHHYNLLICRLIEKSYYMYL